MDDIISLGQRLQKVSTELEYRSRRKREEAQKAVNALATVTPDDVELLSAIVPAIARAVNLTVEEISSNENGEVATLQEICDTLRSFIDTQLKQYEESI